MLDSPRLLIDAHCFDEGHSEGMTTHIAGLYRALIAMEPGIQFTFASRFPDRLYSIFGISDNVNYISLRTSSTSGRLLREFPDIIRNGNFDAAHFQYVAPPLKRIKHIVTLHDILFRDFPQYFPLSYRITRDIAFRMSAAKADMLCTVSKYSAERIAHHYKIPEEKITLTPNAVEAQLKIPTKESIREFKSIRHLDKYILYVSRIEPRKNHVEVLSQYVAMQLWKRGYELVFIGRDSILTPEFDTMLRKLPSDVRRFVRRLDYIADEELQYWYAGADLFIYPSQAEGFGIPPLEAAMAGIPVVCNKTTAMRDFSFFGDNLISFQNSEKLRAVIQSTLDNYPKEKIDDIAFKIREKYSWEKSSEAFLNALEKIL